MEKNAPSEVTLVCRQKEAERLPYFQNECTNGSHFAELVLPDATTDFEKIDLKSHIHIGKTSVFVLPSWSSEAFVFGFMRKLKAIKGKNSVLVYGMPQWRNFENIEPDYFSDLNVHLSAATWIDYTNPDVKTFQEKFYQTYGALPDDDAFNGYDVILFAAKMLTENGLRFVEKLPEKQWIGLLRKIQCQKVFTTQKTDDRFNNCDYLENKFVHILKFEHYNFVSSKN